MVQLVFAARPMLAAMNHENVLDSWKNMGPTLRNANPAVEQKGIFYGRILFLGAPREVHNIVNSITLDSALPQPF
jgi:hypothetical protein